MHGFSTDVGAQALRDVLAVCAVESVELDWAVAKQDGSGVGGVLQQELTELCAENQRRRLAGIAACSGVIPGIQPRAHTATFL